MMNNETRYIEIEVETQNETQNETMTYRIAEDAMQHVVTSGIQTVMFGGLNSPDPTARNMALTIKSGFKALLIGLGGKMVQSLYPNQRDYPRPSRNDDVVEWYLQFFAGQIVKSMVGGITTLQGVQNDEHTVTLTQIRARPVTQASDTVTSK